MNIKLELWIRRWTGPLAALVVLTLVGTTHAQQVADPPAAPKTEKDLPSAQTVLERYVEVTGGIDKYRAIRSMRGEGTISIPQAGINGKIKVIQRHPDKTLAKLTLPGLGEQQQGYNGKTAWEVSTMEGARIVEGEEADQLREEADYRRIYEPERFYKEMDCTGVEEVDGKRCYVIQLVKNNGLDQTDYYDAETGLHVKSIINTMTKMGKLKVETKIRDYQDVDGIKTAHTVEQILPNGMSIIISMDKIEYNVDLPDDAFALPDEVQELLESDDSDQ